MANIPLKVPRLVSLTLAWAFGCLGGAVGVNAIVKRNQEVSHVKGLVAALHITLWVDTWDLLRAGIVLAVGCAVLAVVASIWIGLILLDSSKSSSSSSSARPLSTRLLTAEWASLAFMTVWLLACNIPVTKTAVNGRVHTRAFLPTGVELSQAAVATTERSFGINSAYWSRDYIHLQIIPPWFAFLFALVATVVSFLASRRKGTHTPTTTGEETSPSKPLHPAAAHKEGSSPTNSVSSPVNEKANAEQREMV
ncbi:hypothetical protein FRC17_005555 [Serendipita sp. 399]|nr:hypothetical protein FRC17_005555 [Serendipita sp. 399]